MPAAGRGGELSEQRQDIMCALAVHRCTARTAARETARCLCPCEGRRLPLPDATLLPINGGWVAGARAVPACHACMSHGRVSLDTIECGHGLHTCMGCTIKGLFVVMGLCVCTMCNTRSFYRCIALDRRFFAIFPDRTSPAQPAPRDRVLHFKVEQ